MNNCSYCKNKEFYTLSNGYIKCKKCKKKFSLKKIEQEKNLIKAFCTDTSTLQISKELNLNYITVSKKFMLFRKLITNHLHDKHQKRQNHSNEFDEYIYIKNKNLNNAQNFLTFNTRNSIYNLMLPSINKFTLYNNENIDSFLKFNKIAKLESSNSVINDFWKFFEEFLKKYKGVNTENFIYYLKEAEFKFNYDEKTQEEILLKLYYS